MTTLLAAYFNHPSSTDPLLPFAPNSLNAFPGGDRLTDQPTD